MTYRLLIINDDLHLEKPENLFAGFDVDVEVVHATNIDEGLRALQSWADQEFAADIVTFDIHVKEGFLNLEHVGAEYLEKLEEWNKIQKYKIKKLFAHTTGLKWFRPNYVSNHSDEELYYLSTNCESFFRDDMPLCCYINDEWNAGLPLTQQEILQFRGRKGLIWPKDVVSQVQLGTMSQAQALASLDFGNIFFDPELLPDLDVPSLSFSTGSNVISNSGYIAFSAAEVALLREQNRPAVLVVNEITPEIKSHLFDISGLVVLQETTGHYGFILKSHGIPAVFNAESANLSIDHSGSSPRLVVPADSKHQGFVLESGSPVSIGEDSLYPGHVRMQPFEMCTEAPVFSEWSDNLLQSRGIKVLANVDTPQQIQCAMQNGAKGIGVIRTENGFIGDRFQILKDLWTAYAEGEQVNYDDLSGAQQEIATDLFGSANEHSCQSMRFRLLEVLPEECLGSEEDTKFRSRFARTLHGAPFAVKNPGLYHAQAMGIFTAAAETGYQGCLEIMIPYVTNAKGLQTLKNEVERAAQEAGYQPDFSFGCMIETNSAVRHAKSIATLCNFVSIGTNDLTRGIIDCRQDDVAKTQEWMDKNQWNGASPWLTLVPPVIEKMRHAITNGRQGNPDLTISVCGDQVSADYPSIEQCLALGVNSISVMPTPSAIPMSRIMLGKACARTM
jgi:pyruvate,orthophosphate dikinase